MPKRMTGSNSRRNKVTQRRKKSRGTQKRREGQRIHKSHRLQRKKNYRTNRKKSSKQRNKKKFGKLIRQNNISLSQIGGEFIDHHCIFEEAKLECNWLSADDGGDVGKGAHGVVYKGKYDGEEVAIKVFHDKNQFIKAMKVALAMKDIYFKFRKREADVRGIANPVGGVAEVGAEPQPQRVCLVKFESNEQGEEAKPIGGVYDDPFNSDKKFIAILDFIKGKEAIYGTGKLSTVEVLEHTLNILEQLIPMHDKGIPHRDIKPENIIVTDSGEARLVDYDEAGEIERFSPGSSQFMPVEAFLKHLSEVSPKTLRGLHGKIEEQFVNFEETVSQAIEKTGKANYHIKNDMFALGVTMYGWITGASPVITDEETYFRIKYLWKKDAASTKQRIGKSNPNMEDLIPPWLLPIIKPLINPLPNMRPSARELRKRIEDVLIQTEEYAGSAEKPPIRSRIEREVDEIDEIADMISGGAAAAAADAAKKRAAAAADAAKKRTAAAADAAEKRAAAAAYADTSEDEF